MNNNEYVLKQKIQELEARTRVLQKIYNLKKMECDALKCGLSVYTKHSSITTINGSSFLTQEGTFGDKKLRQIKRAIKIVNGDK